ncbi:MAG TPA: tetraacyldisaccharide 4'-kinase [bacterium]|nr:tetraacyldisaccharide 4'-kinase [bacterium]
MDLENAYLKFLHDRPTGWFHRVLFSFLEFLSLFFLAGWWTRKVLYRWGLRRRKRLTCPVVSVGNVTTGGTGKTPVVIALARYFCDEGKKVAILSRGYGRKGSSSTLVWVSNGKKILATPEQGGDEPVLIAQSVPEAAVLVCRDRYKAGVEAMRTFKPDLFILDDGFQRRFELHRDLDILVVDGINPFSTGRVLPAGLLREPLSSLGEADVIILNKVNLARSPEDIRTILQRHNPRAFIVESRYKPMLLRDFSTGKEMKSSFLERASVGAFSGVANPLSFIRTLADHNVLIRHAYTLRDHFPYTEEKLKSILEDAKMRGLQYLVTTQKDQVKLPKKMEMEIPILVLEIKWEVTGGKNHWETVLKNIALTATS